MTSKRNIKMFISQWYTITALCILVLFMMLFGLSYVDKIKTKKGILDNFKTSNIEYVVSNNYNVTYAIGKDNTLLYSQNKNIKSTLNDFCGIKLYANAYGALEVGIYNFVRIPYTFNDKIIDVQDISDDMLGDGGETFVLLENGNLYLISNYSSNVQLIMKNVSKMNIKRDYKLQKNMYTILDKDDVLSLCYFENRTIIKTIISKEFSSYEINDFYYLSNSTTNNIVSNNYLVVSKGEIYSANFILDNDYSVKTTNDLAFPIKEQVSSKMDINLLSLKNDLNEFIFSEKLLNNENSYYSLYDNKITKITYNSTDNSFVSFELNCEESIEDFYLCGEDACIAITKNGLYYSGDLKYFDELETSFAALNINNGLLYGSRNSLILFRDDGRFYLYNKDTQLFESMYPSMFVNYILRYGSLFVCIMTVFYLIVSFLESNKRYNRYFSVNKNK